jgi:hypothetical protein
MQGPLVLGVMQCGRLISNVISFATLVCMLNNRLTGKRADGFQKWGNVLSQETDLENWCAHFGVLYFLAFLFVTLRVNILKAQNYADSTQRATWKLRTLKKHENSLTEIVKAKAITSYLNECCYLQRKNYFIKRTNRLLICNVGAQEK